MMKTRLSQLLLAAMLVPMSVFAQTGQDYTNRITNPSFETGDLTGWTTSWIDGDVGVKENSNGTYTVSNCNGTYLFNTWRTGDNFVFCCPNQFVEQELTGLPAGEYRLVALAASNTYGGVNTPVWLYANDQQTAIVPKSKTTFDEFENHFFVDPSTQYVKIGTKSASWYKCDHFRLYYLGETEAYRQHLGQGDDQPGQFPELVEYWNGFNTDRWVFTKLAGHDHGNFPYETTNQDVSQFEASRLNYWTGPANRLGNARITRTFTSVPAGWYEFRSQVRVYDENGDFDGTASGLTMFCGSETKPITDGKEISEGNLIGKGFTGEYSVIIKVTSTTDLTIGFETQSASFNWLTWVDTRLLYYGNVKPVDNRYFQRLEDLAGIVEQSNGGWDGFTSIYHEAQTEMKTSADEATSDAIISRVRAAVTDVVKNYPAKTGQYDLTALITNADLTNGTEGWTVANATLRATSAGLGCVENTRQNARISQVLPDMPAGHYTLRAQGFYRGQEMAEYMRNYEKGVEEHKGLLFVNDTSTPLQSLMNGRRYIPQQSSGIQSAIDGRGVPSSFASAPACFALGDYWNSIETTLAADGNLTLGINIQPTTLSDNMTAFSHFRLFYGNAVPEMTFSDSETEFALTEPVTAHVTLRKNFVGGTLTPLCLPFDVTDAQFDELYALGSSTDKQVLLYPVRRVKAGQPCVAKMNTDVESIDMGVVDVIPVQPDTYVLPWGGGTVTGYYMKSKKSEPNYCWRLQPLSATSMTLATSVTFDVLGAQEMDYLVTLENLSARRFISENTYTQSNASVINNYYQTPPPVRRDIPNPVMVPVYADGATSVYVEYGEKKDLSDAVKVYALPGENCYIPNLYPQRSYYYRVVADGATVGKGMFHTDGHLRMIYAPSANNIRDLGGWLTQDKTQRLAYGHIFRGSELNGAHVANAGDLQVLRNLGIGAEIDLRTAERPEENLQWSALGFTDTFYYANGNDWLASDMDNAVSQQHWREEFALVIKTLKKGDALYFHCVWGADRTGLFALLLEGILGMNLDAIFKDYELTSYSLAGARYKDQWSDRVNYFYGLPGATLRDKFEYYYLNTLNISQEDIDFFRSVMLEDATLGPELIDENADYMCQHEGKTDATVVCTLIPGKRNAVVLPFALTSALIRKAFGTGTYVENITSFDGNELSTKKVYSTVPHVPFLLTPTTVAENNTYEFSGVTLVRGGAHSTSFVGGRLVGNYDASAQIQPLESDTRSNYVLNDNAFYVVTGAPAKLKALHASLQLNSTRGSVFFLGETPTAIDDVQSDAADRPQDIYTLSGQRVTTPQRGIYIIGGKKVLIK